MPTPFETATRAAIEEMIQNHTQSGKFGYILTEAGVTDLTNDIYSLLLTSRNLKSAGDRFMQQSVPAPQGAVSKPARRTKW